MTVSDGLAVLLVVFAVIGAAWWVVVTATAPVAGPSPAARRGQSFGASTALSGVRTALGSAAGGVLAVAVGYWATFLVAVAVVVVGAGLSLLAWRRDRSPLRRVGARVTA